ncbi:MAG: type II secretion system protein GspL [Gammaproteobacteria bacterium]|nr:type II secretion system protein GspL [Gammaproteobacteria bacterium]
MADQLFIRLDANISGEVSWARLNSGDEFPDEVGHGPLHQTTALATGCRVTVLVPTIDVLLASATIPTQNRQRILAALPYAFEEQLIEDIDALHFAVGDRDKAGKLNFAAIAHSCMKAWIEELETCAIQPYALVPEVLALPYTEGGWTVLRSYSDMVLVRTGAQSGFSVESESLELVLGIAIAEADTPPAWVRVIDSEGSPSSSFELADCETVFESDNNHPVAIMAQSYVAAQSINLRQGPYSLHEKLGRYWRPWIPVAALAAVWLLLSVALTVSDYLRYKSSEQSLQRQIEQIYLNTFPNARKVVDAQVQMKRKLIELRGNAGRAPGGFINLLEVSGPALKQIPSLQLQKINYKDGVLSLAFKINNLQTLDQLKETLAKNSAIKVKLQSASARGDQVEARLRIEENRS